MRQWGPLGGMPTMYQILAVASGCSEITVDAPKTSEQVLRDSMKHWDSAMDCIWDPGTFKRIVQA